MQKEIVWTDITTYSRSEKLEERKPRIWQLKLTRELAVVVTKGHRHNPGEWTLHFRPWYDTFNLGLSVERYSADEAKAVALHMVRDTMRIVNQSVEEVIGADNETTLQSLIGRRAS